jgi:predicted translin family RNA/ssDNA-binding protein
MNLQLEYLKQVILSQLLLECNENLRFTVQYKQQIKNRINSLNKDLENVVFKEYTKVYKTDAEMTTNILNAIEALVDKLKTSTLDELVMINAVVDKYNENKEWFKEYAEAEFLKIE